VLEQYLLRLESELSSPTTVVRLMPGVGELLEALHARDDCVTGLLTGNLATGAAKKLAAVGIDAGRFAICAFGSDHEERDALPGIAQRRARELLGLDLPGNSVVIIGDTPSDITCGRQVGARAIAVATGRYNVHELRAHGPAAVFENLSDTTAVLRAIFEP